MNTTQTPRHDSKTHLWPTGGIVECLGQFWHQKRRVAEPSLWCRGDIGKVRIAAVRPLFIVGCLGSRNRIIVSGSAGQQLLDRYLFILFIRVENKIDLVYFYVIPT